MEAPVVALVHWIVHFENLPSMLRKHCCSGSLKACQSGNNCLEQ
jgi:hypothetical protein